MINKIIVPTGHILVAEGEHEKPLEFLSLADYGKSQNIKADFLGYEEEINGVPHGELMPLDKKWVITVSSQYGCSMGCTFCDVPAVGSGLNATEGDLIMQYEQVRKLHTEVKEGRINLHYARMGEPTFNPNIISATHKIRDKIGDKFIFHPVISTMMPKKNKRLKDFLWDWMDYKRNYGAGLQLSINSTDEDARDRMFNNNTHSLKGISNMFKNILIDFPKRKGRKIALNFALTGNEIDGSDLAYYFDPERFMCKITPMHMTTAVQENKVGNDDGYYSYVPYKKYEDSLKDAGFDVLVFIPSLEEDKSQITCGNAILSNKKMTGGTTDKKEFY